MIGVILHFSLKSNVHFLPIPVLTVKIFFPRKKCSYRLFVTMFRKNHEKKLTTWNAIWFDKKSPCWDLVDIELRSGPAKGWYGRELRIVGVSTQTCYAAVASFSIQGPLPSPGGWNSLTARFKNNHLDLFEQCFWGGFWCRAEDNDLVHKNKKTLYFSPFL